MARHADYGMVWLNSIFLMFQSFLPFPTALMGEYPVAFNTLLFLVLHAYIARKLIQPELAGTQDPHILRKSFVGPLSHLAGVAAACVYLLTPLSFIVPPQPKGGSL